MSCELVTTGEGMGMFCIYCFNYHEINKTDKISGQVKDEDVIKGRDISALI
jgi:hypothetical protein